MNKPLSAEFMQNKEQILVQVKAGTLDVESALKQLRTLKRQLGVQTVKPVDLDKLLCAYAPAWQSHQINTIENSELHGLLICNEPEMARQCLGTYSQLVRALVQGPGGWQWLDRTGEYDPTLSAVGSLAEALADLNLAQSQLQNMRVLVLLEAKSAEDVMPLCADLLSLAKWCMAVENPATWRSIISAYGDYHNVATEAFGGLLRALKLEKPDVAFSVMHGVGNTLDDGVTQLRYMMQEVQAPDFAIEVRYLSGEREINQLLPSQALSTSTSSISTEGRLFSDDQHWLITGGNGGISRCLMADGLQQKAIRITLVGRSNPSSEIQALIVAHPERLNYQCVDVCNSSGLSAILLSAEQQFGPIDVVMHTAGCLADKAINRTTAEQLERVFIPKYRGLLSILSYYGERKKPKLLLFSSVAAYLPHLGQSLYACANRAMVALATKHMPAQALWSIHWPLWRDGGMQISASDKALMHRETGMLPLAHSTALAAIQFLQAGEHLLLNGDLAEIRQFVQKAQQPKSDLSSGLSQGSDQSYEQIENIIRQLLSDATETPLDKITPDLSLQALGLESMIITGLNIALEKHFGALSKTLLFDCKRVADVVEQIYSRVGKPAPKKMESGKGDGTDCNHKDTANAEFTSPQKEEDIAIIGLSGRYPDAINIDTFWRKLSSAYDAITEIPAERWSLEGFYNEKKQRGHSYAKWGSFVDDVDEFDSLFFSISPREAASMDPQERLFLQQVWHLLENAGYSVDRLQQSSRDEGESGLSYEHNVGVYVGITSGQYQQLSAQDWGKGEKHLSSASYWSVANRVSYFLDLHGPSIAVDSACSSSLTAIQMACEALRGGRIAYAIVGGAHLNLDPCRYVALAEMNFLSSDGKCRSFGEGGDGYVPGEGIGAALLKPLSQAQRDKDRIYAVIRGGAINHGGQANGYTVPNPRAQARLVQRALKDARVYSQDLSYIEAHGTGTVLGDAVEIDGLKQAYQSSSNDVNPDSVQMGSATTSSVKIGSVKSNIGHLESAAGIAGLTKLALQLHYKTLVPSLHNSPINPNLDLDNSPFSVQTCCEPWQSRSAHRIAGLSSFGAGGSNAHLIVAEAPENGDEGITPASRTLSQIDVPLALFSAFDLERLTLLCQRHLKWMQEYYRTVALADYLYSLHVSRTALPTRLAIEATSWEQLMRELSGMLNTGLAESARVNRLFEHQIQRSDSLSHSAGQALSAHHNPEELASRWLNGECIAWKEQWREATPKIVDLPLYPFMKQKHWYKNRHSEKCVERNQSQEDDAQGTANFSSSPLNPLVDTPQPTPSAIPTFSRMDQSSSQVLCWLDKRSAMLAQHDIGGQPILSGTGQLCLVMEAAKFTGRVPLDLVDGYEFCQVSWMRPMAAVNDNLQCYIDFQSYENSIGFKINAINGLLHCSGRLQLSTLSAEEEASLNSSYYVAGSLSTMTGENLYQGLAKEQYIYGPDYRGVLSLNYDADHAQYKLSAPTVEFSCLAPAFLDAALHPIFAMQAADNGRPAVPYRVEKIRVLRAVNQMHQGDIVHTESRDKNEQCYQINTCDEDGKLCVQFVNFVARNVQKISALSLVPAPTAVISESPRATSMGLKKYCYIPIWVKQNVSESLLPTVHGKNHLIVGSELSRDFTQLFSRCLDQPFDTLFVGGEEGVDYRSFIQDSDCVWFLSGICPKKYTMGDITFVESQLKNTLGALLALGKVLSLDRKNKRSLYVIANNSCTVNEKDDAFNAISAGLIGFAKTLAAEASHLTVYYVDLAVDDGALHFDSLLFSTLMSQCKPLPECLSAYRNKTWYIEKYMTQEQAKNIPTLRQSPTEFRVGGIYLIIGGASGLGLTTARYLKQKYRARVILVGRRPAATIGVDITRDFDYRTVDITQIGALQLLLNDLIKGYGEINGVIHSALVLDDKSIARMSSDTLNRVISVKVHGTILLLEALTAIKLDFVLLYSSTIAQTCAAGQANYASASCIQDALARYYRRTHQTIKLVNWGYWHQVGVVATDEYRSSIEKKGVSGITIDEGLAVVEDLLNSTYSQLVALKLNQEGIAQWERYLYLPPSKEPAMSTISNTFWGTNELSTYWGKILPPDTISSGELINRYCHQNLLKILQHEGLFASPERCFSLGEILTILNAVDSPSVRSLVVAIIHMLIKAKILESNDENLSNQSSMTMAGNQQQWRLISNVRGVISRNEIIEHDPGSVGVMNFLEHCLAQLLDLLQGKVSDTEILFPKGSSNLVEALYRDNSTAEACNAMVAKLVQSRVESLIASGVQQINIVEVGAGTGSTTLSVLPCLRQYHTHLRYFFTDLSPHFVQLAKNRFAQEYPWLNSVVLNISSTEFEQEINTARIPACHILLASNVLHATADIAQTLENCGKLLSDDGVILINEVTHNWDFVTLTFGLTKGWWLFEDANRRMEYSPLLSPQLWQQQLECNGYSEVIFFGNEPGNFSLGQSVIAAKQRHGIIERQTSNAPVSNFQISESQVPITEDASVLISRLSEIFNEVLGISLDDLALDLPFQAMGLDSIIFPELLDRLQITYPELDMETLVAANSLSGLVAVLPLGCSVHEPDKSSPRDENTLNENPSDERVLNDNNRLSPHTTKRHFPNSDADVSKPYLLRRSHAQEPTESLAPRGTVDNEIAVIGIAGKYPGADSLTQLWDNLVQMKMVVGATPASRWWEDPRIDQRAAFLSDVDSFDPLFFGISPREAMQLDPQQRLMLEVVWHCLEDAGYTPTRLNNKSQNGVGVYFASMYQHYGQLAAGQWARGEKVLADSSLWSIANRVSHCFDFHGPSMGLDSACSGGLLSIKMACDAIRLGQCDSAVAGGVNLILHPGHHQSLRQAKMLSDTDQCRPFDPQADGMVSGEGVGVVLLKSYKAALIDGDIIYGVICGDACNNKGHSAEGFTVPNVRAEQAVITKAWQHAGKPLDAINYLDVQATGIIRGDRAEAEAIANVLAQRPRQTRIRLGSVKAQLGHLEAASGIAQLTQVLLQFKHRCWLPVRNAHLPPSLLAAGCYMGEQADPWEFSEENELPRYAGISAFGAGGTNVHIALRNENVVETARDAHVLEPLHWVFPFSARKFEQLRELAKNLLTHLEGAEEFPIEKMAFTLQCGRQAMKYRHVIIAENLPQLKQQLTLLAEAPGQGGLDTNELLTTHPILKQPVEAWLLGEDVEWEALYVNRVPGVVSLPGYPFASIRSWLSEPVKATVVAEEIGTLLGKNILSPLEKTVTTAETISMVDDSVAERESLQRSSQASFELDPSNQGGKDVGSAQEIMRRLISQQQSISLDDIDPSEPLEGYGFDSIAYFSLAESLAECFQIPVSPTIFYQYGTVAALAKYFSSTCSLDRSAQDTERAKRIEPDTTAAETRLYEKRPLENNAMATAAFAGSSDMAIVGMAGQFPGSNDLDAFWQSLLRGEDHVSVVPENRFDASTICVPGVDRPFNKGGFVENIDRFDHEFFKLSPREAKLMDPQHRLMLQTVYECIGDAGYQPNNLGGTQTGIFIGVAANDYGQLLIAGGEEIDGQLATGNVHSILVNRISYLLDITGPSEPINTACSSSLVAVHRAVQSIRAGECSQAIVGGVNLILGAIGHQAFAKAGMLSPSGGCHSFDAQADGYVRGEGCAAVFVKPLTQALDDGDYIHAVIKGSAVGHGGRASSLTAPNPDAQAAVIQAALKDAQMAPENINYIETHGTGTQLGDPIEIDALKQVFVSQDNGAPGSNPCALGTVKADIGHLETAAGIAGLIKVVLCMRHELQLPIRGLQQTNRLIDLHQSRLKLLRQIRPWPQTTVARSAGVSSFGFGGVNAHVIVQDAPIRASLRTGSLAAMPNLAVFSAPTPLQLKAFVLRFQLWLARQENPNLQDLCFTLQSGRSQYAYRCAIVVTDIQSLQRALDHYVSEINDSAWFESSDMSKSKYSDTLLTQDVKILEQVAREHQDLPCLARLWCGGLDIEMPLSKGQRRPIPTIPFAQHRHWCQREIPTIVESNSVAIASASSPNASADKISTETSVDLKRAALEPAALKSVSVELKSEALASKPESTALELNAGALTSTDLPAGDVYQSLLDIISAALDMEPSKVDPEKGLSEYGVDSISGLRIMQRVQQRYGQQIPMTAIIEEPTLNRLSGCVATYCTNDSESHEIKDVSVTQETGAKTADAIDPPFVLRLGLLNGRKDEGQNRIEMAKLFLPGLSGEHTWSLHWSNIDTQSVVYQLSWTLFHAGIDRDALIQSIAEKIADLNIVQITLCSQGYMAYMAIAIAHQLKKISGSKITFSFVDPQIPDNLTLSAGLQSLRDQCEMVWDVKVEKNEITAHPEDIKPGLQKASQKIMQGAQFLAWFEHVIRNIQHSIPLLRNLQPRLWVSSGDNEIIHGDSHGASGLVHCLVPPAPVIHLSDGAIYGSRAISKYESVLEKMKSESVEGRDHQFPLVHVNAPSANIECRQTPSFWVHTLLGDVSFTLNLSHHLGRRWPLYGVEQFSVDGTLSLLPSIEEMAAHYIESIKSKQPEGSFVLGGYSFGGAVAYEMCRQLSQQGREVETLILIDSFMPNTETFNSIDVSSMDVDSFDVMALLMVANNFAKRYKIEEELRLEHVSGLSQSEQFEKVATFLATGQTRQTHAQLYRLVENNYNTILGNNNALLSYQPKPLDSNTSVILFHAEQGFIAEDNIYGMPAIPVAQADRSNGFAPYVQQGLHIIDIDADHYSICHDKNIALVAQQLKNTTTTSHNDSLIDMSSTMKEKSNAV